MVMYCRCGHRFWVRERWNGRRNIVSYRDDTEGSKMYGRYVGRCPGCGDQLAKRSLIADTFLADMVTGSASKPCAETAHQQ